MRRKNCKEICEGGKVREEGVKGWSQGENAIHSLSSSFHSSEGELEGMKVRGGGIADDGFQNGRKRRGKRSHVRVRDGIYFSCLFHPSPPTSFTFRSTNSFFAKSSIMQSIHLL